jgi:hypothetical protein
MRLQTALAIILPFFVHLNDSVGQACGQHQQANNATSPPEDSNASISNPYKTIGDIPIPQGFLRTPYNALSFAAWLRQLHLKTDKTVYLYNGSPKRNQAAQFAVVDMPVGNKDLQQCADAVMRLRAEYLYAHHRCNEIDFTDNNRTHYKLPASTGRTGFDSYLEKVFSYCGTLSLSNQLQTAPLSEITPGDVFILGGTPGHAMLVADVAVDKNGRKIYLLVQSYMPAQDIHVVINPVSSQLSPWYAADSNFPIQTPEWTFRTNQLKTWPPHR